MLILQHKTQRTIRSSITTLNRLLLGLLMPILGWGLPMLTGYNAAHENTYAITSVYCIGMAYIIFMVNRFLFYRFIHKQTIQSLWQQWQFRLQCMLITTAIALPSLAWWHANVQLKAPFDGSVISTTGFILFAASFIHTIYATMHMADDQNMHYQSLGIPDDGMLTVLQQQLKAHFVCNALNTLQYLIAHNKKEALGYNKALGNMYRHLMHTATQPTVLLKEELQFVNDYVYVQSFRYGHTISIQCTIDAKAQKNYTLPPLALQVMVENALAYGEPCMQSNTVLLLEEREGYLMLSNPICHQARARHKGHGVALKNLQQQYATLTELPVTSYEDKLTFVTAIPLLYSLSKQSVA